jgi:ribonuclease BN (tRNA processing enzyme)
MRTDEDRELDHDLGIGKMGFVHGQIETIFLTHFHCDHIDGLGELLMQRWVSSGNAAPVPVYGPPGVGQVVSGIMQAYSLDSGYRVAHHGENSCPSGVPVPRCLRSRPQWPNSVAFCSRTRTW